LLPCGHVCLCLDCSERINDFCPVCRAEIQTKATAYIT
jgi:E3 ubiquitin-protein ligase MUL1